jgi:hypothetical protein
MGVWKEQHSGRSKDQSAKGFGRSRTWNVKGSVPDVAATEPEAPRFADPHPDDPGLVVESVQFAPTGFGSFVRALYVPVEFLPGIPPENTTDSEWTQTDTTFDYVDVDIPLFQLITKTFPVVGGGVETKQVWNGVDRKKSFRYTRVVMRLTVNAVVVGGPGVDAQFAINDAILAQTNKIHTIRSKKFLFESDGARRIEKDLYQFTYRWTSDPGIANTLLFEQQASPNIGVIGTHGIPFANANYIVPPFSVLDSAPDDNDPENPPKVVISPQYIEEPAGYLTLPGIAP